MFPLFVQVGVKPNMGSILFSLSGLIGCLISPFLLKLSCMNSQKWFILGSLILALSLGVIALSIQWELDNLTLAMIMLYNFITQSTIFPLYWVYLPQVTSGAVISVSLFMIYIFTLIFTASGPYILGS